MGTGPVADLTEGELDRLRDGRHLRAARTLAGLSQKEFAVAAGCHPNCVRYWEADDGPIAPNGGAVDLLIEVLRKYGIEVATALDGDGRIALIRRRD
jgi:DNA-binding transcriptional regulator YiaG